MKRAALEIAPFRGVLYDPGQAGGLDRVLAPPYDVVSAQERESLAARSPHNVVRLILPSGEGDEKYAAAAHLYRAWLGEGVLRRDAQPAIYRYQQAFLAEGREVTRSGFVAAAELRRFEEGVVVPHERTLSAPRQDRLKLTRACRAWFSQIFALYSDSKGETEAAFAGLAGPEVEGRTGDGTIHRLWRVRDPAVHAQLRSLMQPRRVYIADGHHRYETMLALRDELQTEAARSGPIFFCRIEDAGLVVLATHRVVHSLAQFDLRKVLSAAREWFDVEEVAMGEPAAVRSELARRGKLAPTLGLASAEGLHFLALRTGIEAAATMGVSAPLARLDVTLLHSLLLERVLGIDRAAQERQANLRYVKDLGDALREARARGVQAAFLLNPTPVSALVAVADAGEVMPQKSTYFFPKLASGLVSYPLD